MVMLRKTVIALLAVASIGLVSPTMALARGGSSDRITDIAPGPRTLVGVPHFPRFRALALFGRRPPQCVDSLVMPAFAVGTAVASRPPHRSVRAQFGHTAPTSST